MMPLKNLDYSRQDFGDQRMVRAFIDFLLSFAQGMELFPFSYAYAYVTPFHTSFSYAYVYACAYAHVNQPLPQ